MRGRDVRVPLAHRAPAQTHGRSESPIVARHVRPRVPEPSSPTETYASDAALDQSLDDDMQVHMDSIDVRPDSYPQQIFSCVANGRLYNESDIGVLAAVLKGVDITEIYSPARVTKLCSKYGLIAGDSYDLRDGYDLSDEKTQAQVIRRISSTEPTLVIGSPPCTMFSRIQALNMHVHG